jgi:hypothetical protein
MKQVFIVLGLFYTFMSFMNAINSMEWRTWSLGITICWGFALVFRELDNIKKKVEK